MNKLIQYGLTVVIGVVLFASLLVPCVNTATTQINTVTIDNDGAGWLKLGYNAGEDYDFNIAIDENVTVGEQSGALGDMIYYADPARAIFSNANGLYLIEGGEAPSVHAFADTVSVTSANGSITIKDGTTDVINTAAPAWAYVPDSVGVYGFFTNGGLNLDDKPKVAVGEYADVFTYNNVVVAPGGVDLGLIMTGDYSEGGVIWGAEPATTTEEEPATTTPVIGSTDDWTYSLAGSGSNRFAAINTYTGAPTSNLIIPSKLDVDGVVYDVKRTNGYQLVTDSSLIYPATITFDEGITECRGLFKDCANIAAVYFPDSITSISSQSFSNCVNLVSVKFPSTVVYLGGFDGCTGLTSLQLPNADNLMNGVFSGCTNLKGDLIIPDYPTNILGSAFSKAGFDGSLVIGKGVIKADNYAFEQTQFKNIINLSDATFTSSTFKQVSSVKEILNLGNSTFTKTSYGLNADSVQDHIDALGYIAPVSIHESEIVPVDTPAAQILGILPLIVIGGLIAGVVGSVVVRRYS